MQLLLIDDEIDLLGLWRDYFAATGFDVRTASSVSEADKQLRRQPDVVVIDYRLPDGTAADVLDLIAEHAPAARAILCSGHGTNLPRDVLGRAHLVVSKPLRLDTLRTAIRSVSEPPPPGASS